MVGGEGLYRVASVRDEREQALHPLGVLLERLQVGERFRLGGEARVWLTVGAAYGPALACLAGVEEGPCCLGDGLGGSGHGVLPLLPTPGAHGCEAKELGRCTRSLNPQREATLRPERATGNDGESAPRGRDSRPVRLPLPR